MKILAIILYGYVLVDLANSLNGNGPNMDLKEPLSDESSARDKRTFGIDKNIVKEIELKTKLGTVLKLSKMITYNDGAGLHLLPGLVAAKKKILMEKLRGKEGKTGISQLERGEVGEYVVAGLYNNEEIVSAPLEPLESREPTEPLESHSHKSLLGSHTKALRLKKILFIKKLSDIVSAIASKEKKVGAPCCPNGSCCPGKQG